jgi:beta-glucanase (GH16 family)
MKAAALLLALAAGTACASRGPATAPAPGAGRTVFFEDFAGPALDRTRWNVEVSGSVVNNEQQLYIDSEETLYFVGGAAAEGASNGALVIHARHRPGFVSADGKRADLVSGRMNTQGKFDFAYGTAAARMRLPAGSGLWPAFWALGNGDWPATGEIDVMENVGDSTWTSVALHGEGYSGDTPIIHRYRFPPGQDITGWHVYAVDWSPERLVFTVDGVETYRVTKPMVENYGRWAFDNPKFLILNLALGGAYPQGVNRVTEPLPGLPASTVERIKAGSARVLVDWVRVTQR